MLSFYSMFKKPEAIRLDSRNNSIAEIVNKPNLQSILYKHSSDNELKGFWNIAQNRYIY